MTDPSPELVALDRDHPGFRDGVYRERRNAIARIALAHSRAEPVPEVPYTAAEHTVWRTVWEQLAPLHEARACRRYRDAASALALPRDRIPQLREVNEWLAGTFRMLPVAGLVTARQFMIELAHNGFLATQYVRHHSTPLYTPEPDVIHELVGHAPTLCEPAFAAVHRAFGRAAMRVDPAQVEPLIRLYWYTLEFGLVCEDGAIKAYGAGLLSSFGELGTFEQRAQIVPFDASRAAHTPFDPTDYQPILFVADDLGRAFAEIIAFVDTV